MINKAVLHLLSIQTKVIYVKRTLSRSEAQREALTFD